MLQFQYPISAADPTTLGRGFAMYYPLDWKAQILMNRRPLPIVVPIHGKGMQPVAFAENQLGLPAWLDGSWSALNTPLKFIGIAPQGISAEYDLGGDWNAGNMGEANRALGIDDEAAIINMVLQGAEWLRGSWIAEPPQGARGWVPAPWQIMDFQRISPIGFAEGGQMAYRMAIAFARLGWKVPGLAVFSGSIGGWWSVTGQIASPTAPDADWTPRFPVGGLTIANTPWPSLLHVHGAGDQQVNPLNDGASPVTDTTATAQVVFFNPLDFERWDWAGFTSTSKYEAAFDAGPLIGAAKAVGAFYPAGITAGTYTDIAAGGNSSAKEWNDGLAIKRVVFVHVTSGSGLGHDVPDWGSSSVADFFLTVGAL